MANVKIRNLRGQVIPVEHTTDGGLKVYLLKKREIVVMGSTHMSQDLLDKESAGHIDISNTSDAVTYSPLFDDFGV